MNLLEDLNAPLKYDRLKALAELLKQDDAFNLTNYNHCFVNNHIHTIYSFSPYSPTAAVYYAKEGGLITAGIMDHDTVSGCKEFVEASKIAEFPITCGFETRVTVENTKLYGKKINNPDQDSIAYVAIHGIPHQNIDKCNNFMAHFRAKRIIRNKMMTTRINRLLIPLNLHINYVKDIQNQSMLTENGTVTERHLMNAVANVLINKFGKTKAIPEFLKDSFQIEMPEKIKGYLSNPNNKHYIYDLVGILKSRFLPKVYVDAKDECPTIFEFIDFSNSIGAISAYAYLGDVTSSVTGDKKPQKFEDEYLDLLFEEIHKLGFKAVTYMPSRNTQKQLDRIISLCNKYSLFQISGEDINTSRQKFICEEIQNPKYEHLVSSTFALIGHEYLASKNIEDGMYSEKTIKKHPDLNERIKYFEEQGHKIIY